MIYNDLTRRYFDSPVCAGRLAGGRVVRGAAGDPERGTWVQFDLRVEADRLEAVRFAAFACPHIIAVCAWLAEQAQGTSLHAAPSVHAAGLTERFAVPAEKLGRLLIVEDAWMAAIAAAAILTKPAFDIAASPPPSIATEAFGASTNPDTGHYATGTTTTQSNH